MLTERLVDTVHRLKLCGAILSVLLPTTAGAQHLSVNSRTVYHGYQVQLNPLTEDGPVRDLNRFYQSITLGGYSLGPSGKFSAVASVRYDTDFGTGYNVNTPFGDPIPTVDGQNDIDLMYLYVDWRDVITGKLDARLGRQLIVDDLDWYGLDGLMLMGHLYRDGENYLDANLYGGMPISFDQTFSSEAALVGDGTEISDGTGLALGASIQGRFFRNLSFSASWRNELMIRGDNIQAFGPNNSPEAAQERQLTVEASSGKLGLQESLIGASIGYTIREIDVDLYARANFNILAGEFDQTRAGAAYHPSRRLHIAGEYLRVRPRFLGDSIFNYFNIFPYDRGRLETTLELLPGLRFNAGYFAQVFAGGVTGVSGASFTGSEWTHGPSAGLRYRDDFYSVGASAEAATNIDGKYAFGGNYRLISADGEMRFLDGRISANAAFAVTTVQSDWTEQIDAGLVEEPQTTYVVTVGGFGQITSWLSARVLFAKNFSPVIAGSYRVFSELAVRY